MSDILVAYFSATGTTAKVALEMAYKLKAEMYEIKPFDNYTEKDLDWTNKNSRTTIEANDKQCRPEILATNLSIDKYKTIYLGFPIWWYTAPKIIFSFLEKYDFSGKEIVLFATSGGSGFGKIVEKLRKCVDDSCVIKEGRLVVNRNKKEGF